VLRAPSPFIRRSGGASFFIHPAWRGAPLGPFRVCRVLPRAPAPPLCGGRGRGRKGCKLIRVRPGRSCPCPLPARPPAGCYISPPAPLILPRSACLDLWPPVTQKTEKKGGDEKKGPEATPPRFAPKLKRKKSPPTAPGLQINPAPPLPIGSFLSPCAPDFLG